MTGIPFVPFDEFDIDNKYPIKSARRIIDDMKIGFAGVESIVAGPGLIIDATDPANPIFTVPTALVTLVEAQAIADAADASAIAAAASEDAASASETAAAASALAASGSASEAAISAGTALASVATVAAEAAAIVGSVSDIANFSDATKGTALVGYKPNGTGATGRTLRAKMLERVSVKDYGAIANGTTDDGPAINAAIYAMYLAGGGDLYFPPGVYLIATTLIPRTGVNWIGHSAVSYNADAKNATVLLRDPALLKMCYQSAFRWGVSFIEFEGNNGEINASATYGFARMPTGISLPIDDPLYPGNYPVGSGCYLYRCTFSNFWYAIGDGTSMLSFNITDCMFRVCRSAIFNISDSRVLSSTFTGNKYAGLNLVTGAVHVSGCMFEFNRTGTSLDEAANGIVIYSNANEIQIDGCRFDRNAGQDVYIYAGAKRPRDITIVGNHFMRAAWGTNAANRASVYLDAADRVTITGNHFYAANANPSLSRGLVSPRYAIMHSGCTGLLIKGNQWNNLASKLNLASSISGTGNSQGVAPVWLASASGTDEWYLTDYYDADGNPWIGEPDSVVSNGVVQAAGVAGSLAAGQWDWADNDALGFNTLYCRVTAGGNPGNAPTVTVAYHDKDPVVSHLNDSSMLTRSTDIQTDHFKDAVRYAPAARVLVLNNAVAAIVSNVLSVTLADGHGLVAGNTVYLNDAVTVSVPAGLYEIASVTDAGGGNDYININLTAANATGTVDIYTVSSSTFVLRTRRRGMTYHVLKEILRLSCDQATTLAKAYVEMPFFVTRTNTSTLPTITQGTAVTSVGTLSVGWRSASSNNNVSVALSSDIMGDEITVSIFNTTAYSVEITAEFPW